MKLLRIVLLCWIALGLSLTGCETKKNEENAEGQTEKGGDEEKNSDDTDKDAPEEQLLTAMKTVGDLINDNIKDPDAAIEAVGKYVDENEEKLQQVVEDVRAKADAMTAEEQDKFYEDNTKREEYQLWDGAMRRFEDAHPDRYGELEEITDTIQSAGTEELIEEDNAAPVDVQATLDQANEAYKKLSEMTLDDITKDNVDEKFKAIAAQAAEAEGLFQAVFQNTDDPKVGVESLVKAADLYVMVAKKLRAIEKIEGIEATALAESAEAAAKPLDEQAANLYGTAVEKAAENNVEGEIVERAKAAAEGGDTEGGDTDGDEGAEEGGEEEGTETGAAEEGAEEEGAEEEDGEETE